MSPTRHGLIKLRAGAEDFLLAASGGDASPSGIEAALTASWTGTAPTLLYWDGMVGPDQDIHFGHGGLDPILAAERDLSACVAINERAYRRLIDRGAITGEDDFARATALLARSPGVTTLWLPGRKGRIDLSAPGPLGSRRGAATRVDSLSLVLLLDDAGALEPFLTAVRGQVVAGSIDLVAVAADLEPPGQKSLARTLEACATADPRLRVRRYSISGVLSHAYRANIGVGLATNEAVVIADARCAPTSPNALQRLANWALTGDAATACPRIVYKGRLISAGLALRHDGPGGGVAGLSPWTDSAFSEDVRTVAAPAPGLFAVRRSAWLAAGGLRGHDDDSLWTAELAFARAPKGRSLLVGTETAEWMETERPFAWDATAGVHRNLQLGAGTALRDPVIQIEGAPVFPVAGAANLDSQAVAFTDTFSGQGMRLLVFADAMGPSQEILFIEGLATARARGEVAVRVVEEAAFAALDPGSAQAFVSAQFDETVPHLVVVSRLGAPGLWGAVKTAAKRRGVRMVAHLDDDLFGLPATLGIDRFRLARNPRRLATLQDTLDEAVTVIATTPALAATLALRTRTGKIEALESGAAATPATRPERSAGRLPTIGYMASASHAADLAMITPALNRLRADNPGLRLVLFGSIAKQSVANGLEGPVERHPPVRGYGAFKARLLDLAFDIGLAPLLENDFNRLKTPVKWAEYAEAGVATVASPIGPYLDPVGRGAAVGALPHQWEAGIRRLLEDRGLRTSVVARADALLLASFAWDRLEGQLLNILRRATTAERDAA